MNGRLRAPIAILDEHPEWSSRLIAELQARRLPYEKIDHSNHSYDPRDRQPELIHRCPLVGRGVLDRSADET